MDGDVAAGPPFQHITLAAPGLLPSVCCKVPALSLFLLMGGLLVAAFVSQAWFYVATAVLSAYVFAWSANLSISQAVGALQMRRATSEDWDLLLEQRLEQHPEDDEVMHVVILPNYKEDEQMMQETLENIGKSAIARSRIHVCLAMEAREEGAVSKAEGLMSKTGHLFSDIFATYHPPDIRGEVAGKSSNTQWAYRHVRARYAARFAQLDPSKVFLSVGDADTLWHPHFFSALAVQGLRAAAAERVWSIWQPPILLMRNLFSVPGVTRVSAYGTLMFELCGLANQLFGTHMCYSTYSMTLALASHPEVNGWDTDVIAEDHHMFCKCYFAALREAALAQDDKAVAIEPKVNLRPVWLPAVSYLVETSGSWVDSAWARFQQARRHSQGIAELSYVLLQYVHLVMIAGLRLPLRTHTQALGIAWKMHTVHVTNAVQAFAMTLTIAFMVPEVLSWVFSGGLVALLNSVASQGLTVALNASALDLVSKAIVLIFGPLPLLSILITVTVYSVVNDLLSGRYYEKAQEAHEARVGVTRQEDGSSRILAVQGAERSASFRSRLSLLLHINQDASLLAQVTILLYGLLPVSMAAWSLLRSGTKFEYIVAAKPDTKPEAAQEADE